MKTFLCFFLVTLAALGGMASAQTVVVDMNQVFQEYIRTQEADRQMQASIQNYRQGQQELQERFRVRQEAFNEMRQRTADRELDNAERQALAEEAAEMLNELRALEQELRQEDTNRQRQIEEQGRRMRNRIVEEIQGKITELATARNWTLVLDSSATSTNGLPVVLHAMPAADVTGEVIQALNQPILQNRAAGQAPATGTPTETPETEE